MRIYFTILFLVGCAAEIIFSISTEGPRNPCILEGTFQQGIARGYRPEYGERQKFVARRRAALVAMGAIIMRDEKECLSSGHKTVIYY